MKEDTQMRPMYSRHSKTVFNGTACCGSSCPFYQ